MVDRASDGRLLRGVGGALAAVGTAGGIAAAACAWRGATFFRRERARVRRTGYVTHTYTLTSGVALHYAEGPDDGPAVLLIHGQSAAWESYSPVLPDLARGLHVFAVDVVGHGGSAWTPDRYDVHTIGADLVTFIDEVIGGPVILSGHSSGGLLAAWIAAAAPELVSAVLFEDPPFFSTDPDRMPRQFNYVDLARPAHEFLAQRECTDFPSWYIAHNGWIPYLGRGGAGLVAAAQRERRRHPERPLNLWFLPPSINRVYRYLDRFDPEFADAFYRCVWQAGFDQESVLRSVTAPSILIHANWRITEAGILEGAMTDDDAARACAAMPDCRIERVDTGHGFHDADPALFVSLLRELASRGGAP